MLLSDRCLVAINVAQAIDIQADELISIQGSCEGHLGITHRCLKGREGALIEEEGIGSWPILAADDDVITVAADHLTLVVNTRESRVAGSRVIYGRELPVLVDEPVIHEILIFVNANDTAGGVDAWRLGVSRIRRVDGGVAAFARPEPVDRAGGVL